MLMTSDCIPTPVRLLQWLVGGRGAPTRAVLHACAQHGALPSPQVGAVLPPAQSCMHVLTTAPPFPTGGRGAPIRAVLQHAHALGAAAVARRSGHERSVGRLA